MDHLSLPADSTLPPVEIPFICANEPICNASAFLQWPKQQDWTRARSQTELAVRTQSWLYFGLLMAFLNEDFEREELTKIGLSGHQVIDSRSMGERLVKWQRNSQEGTDTNESQAKVEIRPNTSVSQDRAEECLRCAILAMNDEVIPALGRLKDSSDADIWSSPTHAVILAIDILIDLLIGAVKYLCDPKGGLMTFQDLDPRKFPRKNLTAENQVMARSMLRAGRCPSVCWRLRLSSSQFYLLLLLPPIGTGADHSTCTARKCTVHNVDSRSYKTLHTADCKRAKSCRDILVNASSVAECIHEGRIPLISLSEDSKEHLVAKVVNGSVGNYYTAISHVWSGGLGNFQSNGLPYCQLKRLRALLHNLPYQRPESPREILPLPAPSRRVLEAFRFPSKAVRGRLSNLFWMDSLCVPIDKELKNKAIDSMAEIYAGASNILVLDPELQQISLKTYELYSTLLTSYIKCSPWMARSWTLQEGALALDVFFVFADGLLSAREYIAQMRREFPRIPILSRNGLHVPWQRVFDLESMGYKAHSVTEYKSDRFIGAWNELATRSTSQQKDIPGIFANLVGLNAAEVVSLPVAERMKAIIKTQELIPLSILYERPSASEGNYGAAWVPPFPGMDDTVCSLDASCGTLQVTANGFVVKDPGYKLMGFIVRAELSPVAAIHLRDQRAGEEVWVHVTESSKRVANTSSKGTFLMFTSVPALGRDGMPGALFTIQDVDSSSLTLSYRSSITTFFSQPDLCRYESVEAEKWIWPGSLTRKVLIEADIKSWPVLKWSRQSAFPFNAIYNDYLMIWFFSSEIAWILTWFGGAGYVLREKLWPDENMLPFIICGLIRLGCIIIDLPLWFLDLQDFVHQQWAASFSNRRTPRTSSPPSLTMGMNVVSLLAGFIMAHLWIFFHWRWLVLCGTCLLSEILLRFALAPLVRRFYVTPFLASPVGWDRAEASDVKRLISLTRDV